MSWAAPCASPLGRRPLLIVMPAAGGPLEHHERLGYVVSGAIVATVLFMYKIDRLIAGGVKASLHTRPRCWCGIGAVRHEADLATLEVSNEGPVIPRERIPELFRPFQPQPAAADASQSRGLGLGLYITDQIVRAHGGSIVATSTPEAGTTFTVHLPLGRRLRL